MDSAALEATPEPQVVFRGKKRKTYRQRAEPASDNNNINDEESKPAEAPRPDRTQTASPSQADDATEEENGLSVAEVLRLRNARKARLGGVKFGGSNHVSAEANAPAAEFLDDLSLMIREEESKANDVAAGVQKRFAPQTGLSTEIVNKHMEEYIESELARRHHAVASSSSTAAAPRGLGSSNQEPRNGKISDTCELSETAATTAAPKPEHPHRALQGQLMEIDLGDEARSRNEALTERATRRMHGEAVAEDEDSQSSNGGGRPRKVRLGRDGKPWRSRNRRTSDDIRRDQLVEQILRENKLDVYETPTPPAAPAPGTDSAADDRIAEEFRREFMDAQAERQQKRKKPANAPPGAQGAGAGGKGQKDEDVLKGPKLGGSRNVRAAMRNLLLEKAKEAKKPGR
ncbi:hepatocellular carcinoma-associated antigen 59-domain-containing protein [Annulohypoxylon bovei var. microspora]|nr:hepatocellular carcinoma-associated antigen 59-domain-containing protein [Annulohypoxylon bovei var. microspora]